jgi:hypothetical protein
MNYDLKMDSWNAPFSWVEDVSNIFKNESEVSVTLDFRGNE